MEFENEKIQVYERRKLIIVSSSNKRREILSGLMKLLVFIGFIFLSIPFISTFTSNDIEEKQKTSTRWVIALPISELVEGEIKKLNWSGGLVWVYPRNAKDIQSLKIENSVLRDRHSTESDQQRSPRRMSSRARHGISRCKCAVPV